MPAHIDPVLSNGETRHSLSRFEHDSYQVGHVETTVLRDVVPGRRIQQISSCVDEETETRLLLEARDTHVVAFHDSKGNLHIVLADSDGDHRRVLAMEGQHFTIGD